MMNNDDHNMTEGWSNQDDVEMQDHFDVEEIKQQPLTIFQRNVDEGF